MKRYTFIAYILTDETIIERKFGAFKDKSKDIEKYKRRPQNARLCYTFSSWKSIFERQ